VTGRRQQAKMTVRKYIDDVNFLVGKDFRDTMRHLQRELHDNLAGLAEELQRTTAATLQAVQQSAQQDQTQRQQRLQTVDNELKRLANAKAKLQQMMSAPTPEASGAATTPERSGGATTPERSGGATA